MALDKDNTEQYQNDKFLPEFNTAHRSVGGEMSRIFFNQFCNIIVFCGSLLEPPSEALVVLIRNHNICVHLPGHYCDTSLELLWQCGF